MSGSVFLVIRILVTISLYIFISWILVFLIREIRKEGNFFANRKTPPITLSIQNPASETQVRLFTQPEITIGRDPACECPIKDRLASTHHARLSYHHNQWWLEDTGSKNGTCLNQQKVETPTVIISGDEFECGKTKFTISISKTGSLLTEIESSISVAEGELDENEK
jgi:pSer/pThr/pTyr-binding forkhead associated (FHA) protein